ncbi:MAG: (2Fe-2S) ferredoxin domain-containing protein [Cyanobacteria bacterium SIG28]|nr:(2Fe-2S) ferredoxin domain-containing protein [Cyanobacteria bacterium SIG28]
MTTEIKICMGSACFARGNYKNAEIIEKFIEDNNLDAKIELYGALCENKCEVGPNIYIDDKIYNNVDEEKLMVILESLKND